VRTRAARFGVSVCHVLTIIPNSPDKALIVEETHDASTLTCELRTRAAVVRLCRCRAEGYMFTTAAKVSMGLQLCAGLAELASLGILHRDIASRNVLVHRMHPIHVKICDFGMAQSSRKTGREETGTAAMQASALVPLRWLPPECLCGVPQWSTASDVWAFGEPVYLFL
jgi:serine/threonine protein kinase